MLVRIPGVLSPAEAADARARLGACDWVDGRVTAGHQSAQAKHNHQLPEGHPLGVELGDRIIRALQSNALFVTAALPLHVFPPLFNRYGVGQSFGSHVDNSIRQVPGTPHRIRTDLSCTLFLSGPDEYEGGELMIEDVYGVHAVKLPAGELILYPATSLHHVRPVTSGARVCSFFWIQSMVRDDASRSLLFDLDNGIRALAHERADHPVAVSLTAVYHNLLRRWAEM